MPFITYSQNFEDLMLYRALRHVDKGLYIDLGAADPDSHSVTRAFYERGWRGINVEPNPWFFARLAERRVEDVNINAAVSDATGEAEFFFVGENTGLSTLDRGMAHWHESQGLRVRAQKSRVYTLRDICERQVGDKQIHFLKIDVEDTNSPSSVERLYALATLDHCRRGARRAPLLECMEGMAGTTGAL